jgi:hypothetical protein
MRTVFFGLLGMRAIVPDMAGRVPLILGFLVLGFFARVVCDAFRGFGAGWSSSLSASLAASLISSSDSSSPFSASSSPSSSFRLRFGADAIGSGAYLVGALTTRPDRRRAVVSGSGDAVALLSIVSSLGRWICLYILMRMLKCQAGQQQIRTICGDRRISGALVAFVCVMQRCLTCRPFDFRGGQSNPL